VEQKERVRAFVDTGAFAALYKAEDEHSAEAHALWKHFQKSNPILYTSNYVVSETIILLRVRAGFSVAERFGDDIFSSSAVRIFRVNEHHESQAWSLFKKYSDHDFSFVDCCSFVVMRDMKINSAFAFDHHFTIMGFELLS
jgi:predicted nucleic acid-binding protein